MAKFLAGASKVYDALYEAGVIENKPEDVRRVIIDLEAGNVAKIYVELFADERLLDVLCGANLELVGPAA